MRRKISAVAAIAAAALTVTMASCAPPNKSANSPGSKVTGKTQGQSAASYMTSLISKAKAEGHLNVIALPPDWANYGKIIAAFQSKYGISVTSANPEGASQDEIDAANQLAGTSRAPDVFDLSQAVALANTSMFAPYKVQAWDNIPTNLKDPNGLWVNDYGGYMSIGYDSSKFPGVNVTGIKDLLNAAFKGKVALNGDPTLAGAAFSGVMMASIANGGSADNIAPGVDFFKQLKAAGNFLPVDPSSTTVASGQTPCVIDWDYLNLANKTAVPTWKVVVPANAVLGGYYFQAINKNAPDPYAARLWEEFLYSAQGQNLWLQGGARPVEADAMIKNGTIDETAYKALPPVVGTPVIPTAAQTTKAAAYLSQHWAEVTG